MKPSKSPDPKTASNKGQKDGETNPNPINGGDPYTKPLITPKLIDELSHNPYIVSALTKLRNLIFSDYYRIWVTDPDGNEDEQLTKVMTELAESQGNRLWVTMQQAWMDRRRWGCMILNEVWELDGAVKVPTQFRRLPPETFTSPPPATGSKYKIFNPILQGITVDDKGDLHLFQSIGGYKVQEVVNARLIKDPTDPRLGGTSDIEDLVGMLSMANYSWKTLMQKVNREGSPIVFPRVIKDRSGRIDNHLKAETIAKNWGKDTAFTITEGIEIESLNIPVNNTTLQAIDKISAFINDFFSPKSMLERSGGVAMGEGAGAKADLTRQFMQREHRWIEDSFEEIYQQYLDENMYTGFRVNIMIDKPEKDDSTVKIQQAAEGWRDKVLHYNEVRERLGAEPKSLEQMQADKAERDELFPVPVFPAFPAFPAFGGGSQEEQKNIRHIHMQEGEPTKEMLTLEHHIKEIDKKFMKDVVKAIKREDPVA